MKSIGIHDAKTRLSEILGKVRGGAEYTITHRGKPVARLLPIEDERKALLRTAVERMRRHREGKRLGGLSVREMIEEGRRH